MAPRPLEALRHERGLPAHRAAGNCDVNVAALLLGADGRVALRGGASAELQRLEVRRVGLDEQT